MEYINSGIGYGALLLFSIAAMEFLPGTSTIEVDEKVGAISCLGYH